MNKLGLYIHIPFCKSKCRYCDFCSFPHPKEETVDAYLSALIREIEEWGNKTKEPSPLVDTVYFGGGTPTLLSVPQWERLTNAVFHNFHIAENAEITAECNPATADPQYLRALRAVGVNRLSVGAQSMDDGELRLLGRLHCAKDVVNTFSDARTAGFENISADIMFGLPDGTRQSLAATLNAVCALSPDHISVYGLQIEDGTYFARHRDELTLPDEDTEREMYVDTVAFLADRGLHRYEISNFSRTGMESRHNLKYWNREDYLGLGLSAHSCLGDHRFSNTVRLSDYLEGNRSDTDERISAHDALCEAVMLGMRLDKGVDFSALATVYGSRSLFYRDALARYISGGFIVEKNGCLAFTDDGMYVSNTILGRILDFDE